MKKFIALLLSFTLLFGLTATANATEHYGDGKPTTNVSYHVDSSYIVLIPETIDLNAESCTLSVSNMNITDNEYININIDSPFLTLSNGTENTLSGTIEELISRQPFDQSKTIATFSNDDSADKEFSYYFDVEHMESASAGTYTGTITFNISLMND